jgi:hypothetical protein
LTTLIAIRESFKFAFGKVSITAEEESEVLVWHRDRLKFLLMADPFLQVFISSQNINEI